MQSNQTCTCAHSTGFYLFAHGSPTPASTCSWTVVASVVKGGTNFLHNSQTCFAGFLPVPSRGDVFVPSTANPGTAKLRGLDMAKLRGVGKCCATTFFGGVCVPAFSNCSKSDILRCSRRLIISKVFMGVSVESGECAELSTCIFVLTSELRAGLNAQFVSCAETVSKDPAKPHRKSH
jgi:hypothetical protein